MTIHVPSPCSKRGKTSNRAVLEKKKKKKKCSRSNLLCSLIITQEGESLARLLKEPLCNHLWSENRRHIHSTKWIYPRTSHAVVKEILSPLQPEQLRHLPTRQCPLTLKNVHLAPIQHTVISGQCFGQHLRQLSWSRRQKA
jgi:hypothetical protein